MTASIKAIVFDFGGVLLQWDPHRLYRRYFDQPQQIDEFLAEINFTSWNAEQDRGRPFAEGMAELSDRFPHYAHLIHAYYDHFEDTIVGPISGSVEILRRLKQAGYPVYGLSNWSSETYAQIRPRYDFLGWFDKIVLSGEAGLIKPDPAIFKLLLQRIDHLASECLLIDDSDANIDAAKQLDFITIHFRSPEQLQSELHRT